jgi:thymidylate kinase
LDVSARIMLQDYLIDEQYNSPLKLLKENNLSYVLFKQTKKYNHSIGGLDILITPIKKYKESIDLLNKNGFSIYFSEKNEPYKTMMVKYCEGFLLVLHIHRQIGWLGMKCLTANEVEKTKIKLNELVYIPSFENQLMIHISHILFENYKIEEYEYRLISDLLKKELDWKYIYSITEAYGWKYSFSRFIGCFKTNPEELFSNSKNFPYSLKNSFTVPANFKRIFSKDFGLISWFLFKQIFQFFSKRASLKRKGTLIAFSGVNGSGKTTLSKGLLKAYAKLFDRLNLNSEYYYFGWKPIFPWTKLISKKMEKKGKRVYDESINKEKIPNFSLKLELLFLYVFIEDLFRYLFHIYPKLRKRELVVSDRYFYRMYGQYPYAKNSRLIKYLVKMFPRPDFTFLLEVEVDILAERRKDQTRQNLEEQRDNYTNLIKIVKPIRVKSRKFVDKNLYKLIEVTWKDMFRKLGY